MQNYQHLWGGGQSFGFSCLLSAPLSKDRGQFLVPHLFPALHPRSATITMHYDGSFTCLPFLLQVPQRAYGLFIYWTHAHRCKQKWGASCSWPRWLGIMVPPFHVAISSLKSRGLYECFSDNREKPEILKKEDMFLVKPVYSLTIPYSYSHVNIFFLRSTNHYQKFSS